MDPINPFAICRVLSDQLTLGQVDKMVCQRLIEGLNVVDIISQACQLKLSFQLTDLQIKYNAADLKSLAGEIATKLELLKNRLNYFNILPTEINARIAALVPSIRLEDWEPSFLALKTIFKNHANDHFYTQILPRWFENQNVEIVYLWQKNLLSFEEILQFSAHSSRINLSYFLTRHVAKLSNPLVAASFQQIMQGATRLEGLKMLQCTFRYTELQVLSTLTNLKNLYLNNSRAICKEVIGQIACLTTLQELRLCDCRLPQGSVMAFTTLVNLNKLELVGNSFQNTAVLFLSCLPNLEVLDLSENALKTGWDTGLRLTKLRVLNLKDNNIEDVPVDFPQLCQLNLGQTHISDENCQNWTKLTGLQALDLSHAIGDAGFQALGLMTNLQNLNLSHTAINDQTFAYLISCLHKLTSLQVAYSRLEDAGFNSIDQCTQLLELDLSYAGPHITWATYRKIEQLTQLRALAIGPNESRLTYYDLKCILRSTTGLEKLKLLSFHDLHYNLTSFAITPTFFAPFNFLGKNLTNLKMLVLEKCELNEECLTDIAKITSLTKINLPGSSREFKNAQKQLEEMPNLHALSFGDRVGIAEEIAHFD